MPIGRDSLAVTAIVLATAFLAAPAHAATFTVNNPGDQGDALPGDGKCDSDSQGCTLRAATEEAGPSAIDPSNTINVPSGTYDLVSGPLTLSRTTTIAGAGARTTLIRQTGRIAARVFEIGSGTTSIRQVTMSGGTADSSNGFFGGNLRAQGGATVTVEDSTVTGGNGSSGGGLSNVGGTMTVRRSTIAGNNALSGGGDGGGIQNTSGRTAGSLIVENSTVSGNEARLAGGIISGGNAATSVTISDSTIAGNNAKDRTDLPNGGGMSILDGTATVVRSIVAGNTSIAMTTPNCASDPLGAIPGTIASGGNNLESGTDCAFKAGGDLQSSNPQLGALANNGGQTDTRAMPVTSPAHDVYTAACIATDQRGISRPQGPACDIGAFELLDTAPPDTIITGGPSGPTNTVTPTFTFSSTEPAGSTFQCRVDSAALAACTSPHTTAALSQGPHTFEVRAIDRAGNIDPTPATRAFTVDTAPPDTTITGGPSGPTNTVTPTFTFTSTEPGAGSSFQCRVASAAFAACTSPHTTAALGQGSHTFEVRAIDALGNVDPSPATRAFTVDTAPPDTTITAGPSGPTNTATPIFTFTSTEPGAGSSFQCRVDTGAFAACTSPHTTAALSQGAHTFEVRAIDPAGNIDPTAASRAFTVDTAPPDTTITAGPSGTTADSTPSFEFSSSEPESTFQCRVDTADFTTCTSPHTTTALSGGQHTFEVRATDGVGNVDQTPASRTFTVDRPSPPAAPPDTSIILRPPVFTRDRTPTFTFSSNLAGAKFECSLDGAPFSPCTSPFISNRALRAGRHEFRVRARNAAGSVDPSPATAVFAIPAKLSDLPPPKLGRTFNVEPVGDGDVFVSEAGGAGSARARASAKVPGVKGRNFTPLREARQLRVGSFFDTRRGRVRLLTARNARGATQSGEFFSGVFQTLQSRKRSAKGLTELRLKGSSFRGCTARGKKAGISARRIASRRRIRRLSGNARGRFRTRGRHSAATVRGTVWTVTDRCDGTLTKVTRGKVAVRDFRRRKSILVRRGKSYLARARR